MSRMQKRTLYWFTQDLRVEDNAALRVASQCDKLYCLYVIDRKWFQPSRFQSPPMGSHRWRFLVESLKSLDDKLSRLGQKLHIIYGDTYGIITEQCRQANISHLVVTELFGADERNSLLKIKSALPEVTTAVVGQYSLYNTNQFESESDEQLASYSKFKKVAMGLPLSDVAEPITQLPPPLDPNFDVDFRLDDCDLFAEQGANTNFTGGESAALTHLQSYFNSEHPLCYKNTRNALDGWENSSKFSAWLAFGCLSVRQIVTAIQQFEAQHGSNESTQWLFLEILWREYFQWLHLKHGSKFFQFQGLVDKVPLTSFYPERFKKWCEGTTPYPLVNACMNELRKTGYLSNRGRQIVASCLVNELSVDWRYGAAWFEHMLVDYDVAVNWGNWQYIAGVGVDPRGGRHFNLEKQTQMFDPHNHYVDKWYGESSSALDSVDAADWPISGLG